MTDPDPIAALAEQIHELRGQLARYTGETGYLRARMEEDSGQVLMLRLEIKKLSAKLDEAIARRQTADPPAPFWLGLSREEHAVRLGEVRAWVENVARRQWPGYLARLAPCWANHPEAVWELSNLAAEWGRVYGDPDSRPLQDALWFFERWLPGVLSRLAQAVKCDVAGCRVRSPPPKLLLTFGRDGLVHGLVDAEDPRQPGDLEDHQDPLLRADQIQRAVMRPDPLQAAGQHPQPGGVEEPDLVQVDDEVVAALAGQIGEQLTQPRRGIDIDLALDGDDLDAVLAVMTQLQIHNSSSRRARRHRGVRPGRMGRQGHSQGGIPTTFNHAPLSPVYEIMPSGIPQRMTH